MTDREKLIVEYLKEEKVPERELAILHTSPEEDSYNLLKDKPGYVPTQFAPESTCMSFLNETLELMDIEDIKKPDESFDLIICSHVLEHVENDKKAMRELYRVLKLDGKILISVPLDMLMAEFAGRDITTDHMRSYEKSGFIKRLNEIGFKVAEWKSLFVAEKL